MHFIDLLIFFLYMAAMVGMGFWFMRRNKNADDYYVGGRSLSSLHVGLSVVATDVGGGFSIGLGGLGFLMGLSGSWMLFTGLIGAWLSAVLLIPKVKKISEDNLFLTFPDLFRFHYGPSVALLAGIISGIGYIGFTSSQILAGAKLASATFIDLDQESALWIMGVLVVFYTVLGGIKAVIYTDTVQWIILMGGLVFIGLPLGFMAAGGFEGIRAVLPDEFLSFTNIGWRDLVNWAITIIPIWFVGMTLYQRIYACKSEKDAKKAWFYAGLFEWPVMAIMGVALGLFARVAAENGAFGALGFPDAASMDAEKGLPMLLRTIMPVGLMGLMLSAYFSAIMSTADSCLMAASGNVVSDILARIFRLRPEDKHFLRISQVATLFLGIFALLLAMYMTQVLELMLYSYAFMVSGLFIPVIGILFMKKKSPTAAFASMIAGGAVTLFLIFSIIRIPTDLPLNELQPIAYEMAALLDKDAVFMDSMDAESLAGWVNMTASDEKILQIGLPFSDSGHIFRLPWGLSENIYGILASLAVFLLFNAISGGKNPYINGNVGIETKYQQSGNEKLVKTPKTTG